MRNPGAVSLLIMGIFFLGLALLPGVMDSILVTVGVPDATAERTAPVAVMATAATSLGMIILALFLLVGSTRREQTYEPYRKGLERLAAEHGQAVDVGEGLSFVALREGQVISVEVLPEHRASLVVRSPVKGRQALAFVRPEDAPGDSRALRVGGGTGWELRAELPSIARAIVADAILVSHLDRFFSADTSIGVIHDVDGIEVTSRLPPSHAIETRARDCIEIASCLRRVNG
jgi:hypothetical protein